MRQSLTLTSGRQPVLRCLLDKEGHDNKRGPQLVTRNQAAATVWTCAAATCRCTRTPESPDSPEYGGRLLQRPGVWYTGTGGCCITPGVCYSSLTAGCAAL